MVVWVYPLGFSFFLGFYIYFFFGGGRGVYFIFFWRGGGVRVYVFGFRLHIFGA